MERSTIQANASQSTLEVIEDACTVKNPDGTVNRQGRVVIEGDSMSDVMSAPAKQMAIDYAARCGMKDPGTGGTTSTGGAYPTHALREDGTVDESKMLQAMPEGTRYRVDYTVTAMI